LASRIFFPARRENFRRKAPNIQELRVFLVIIGHRAGNFLRMAQGIFAQGQGKFAQGQGNSLVSDNLIVIAFTAILPQ
jgi:hypothetical protein